MLGTTKEIYLRAASERDEALLLRWANESYVRSNSYSPNSIEPRDHKEWFQDAGRFKSAIINCMKQMGVPLDKSDLI